MVITVDFFFFFLFSTFFRQSLCWLSPFINYRQKKSLKMKECRSLFIQVKTDLSSENDFKCCWWKFDSYHVVLNNENRWREWHRFSHQIFCSKFMAPDELCQTSLFVYALSDSEVNADVFCLTQTKWWRSTWINRNKNLGGLERKRKEEYSKNNEMTSKLTQNKCFHSSNSAAFWIWTDYAAFRSPCRDNKLKKSLSKWKSMWWWMEEI